MKLGHAFALEFRRALRVARARLAPLTGVSPSCAKPQRPQQLSRNRDAGWSRKQTNYGQHLSLIFNLNDSQGSYGRHQRQHPLRTSPSLHLHVNTDQSTRFTPRVLTDFLARKNTAHIRSFITMLQIASITGKLVELFSVFSKL